MQNPRELLDLFIKPWIAKNHPHADIVILAGSYGRALQQGNYQPVASSDADIVVIYSDLKKGGMEAAMQTYTYEDVGTAMGKAPDIMMIDANIHDFASLHFLDKCTRDFFRVPFMNVMIDEGYVIMDKTGVTGAMKEEARRYLSGGPTPFTQKEWAAHTNTIETYLQDIRDAQSTEDKRFLGTLALAHVCDYILTLHNSWIVLPGNQAYRALKDYPQDEKALTEAFSDLMRNGDSSKAETLLDDLLKRGAVHAKTLQAANDNSASSVFAYIPKEESQKIGSTFMKFMTGHVVESLDTSSKRGELAYLECLSASLELIRRGLDVKTGESPRHGAAAIHYFGQQLPDVMPVTLQALDEGLHKPLHQLADKVLADVGGMHYSHLENYYIMDVGRIYKARSEAGREPVVKSFNAHFRP